MAQAHANWIKLDRNLSPVQAAVKFGKDLKAAGKAPVLLSQGAEEDLPSGKLRQFLQFEGDPKPAYNTDVGGSDSLKEAAGAWIERFIGVPANKDNTFVLQVNGRDGLGEAFYQATRPFRKAGIHVPKLIAPVTRWPMVDDIAERYMMDIVSHDVARGKFADNILSVLQTEGNVAAVYTNSPHNPTSLVLSQKENKDLMDGLEAHNKGKTEKTMHVIDNPYFGGLPQKTSGAFLENGYDGVLSLTSETPWAVILSGSKAFGTAQPGYTIIVVHPSLALEFKKAIASQAGVSYTPDFFAKMTQFHDPSNDAEVLAHFKKLHDKYATNSKTLEAELGKMVVEGDPGMTRLLALSQDLIGKKVQCSDGIIRDIIDLDDVVEFLGNEADGVVTVNNGAYFLRLALKAQPDTAEEGIRRVKSGLEKLKNAPSL